MSIDPFSHYDYYICKTQFFLEDGSPFRNNKDSGFDQDTSLPVIDCYAWIPAKFREEVPNHRLSMRYRFSTDEFEVFRLVWRSVSQDEREVVVFKSKDLQETCTFMNDEVRHYHGHEYRAIACDHHKDRKRDNCKAFQQEDILR